MQLLYFKGLIICMYKIFIFLYTLHTSPNMMLQLRGYHMLLENVLLHERH